MPVNNINTKKSLNPVLLKKSIHIVPTPTQKSVAFPERKDKEKDVIISVNKGHKEVLTFLQELNMGDFFDNFINNGIVNKEKLFYLNNDNLKLIQIPYAYRVRFLKKLKEIKNLETMKKSLNEKGKLSKIKLKKEKNESKYEEIFIPKEEDDKEISNEEMSKTFTQAIYDFQKTHSRFEFDANEEENISENISNNTSNINSLETKTTSNINKISTEINNSKIDSEIQNDEEEPIEVGEYVESKNNDENNKIKQLLPLHCKKILCYQCWNVILRKDCLVKYGRPFCSMKCFDIYDNINYIKCKTCSKKIRIVNSLPSFNNRKVYYCSLECLEQIEPERKNWMKKNLIDDDNASVSSSISNISEKPVDILDL